MANLYQLGRLGRVWAAKQTTFGTAPVLASTDAIRHLNVKLNYNPRNRVNSPERLQHPSQVTRFTRRTTADWAIDGIFYPSGTLNTLPDHTDFLECGLGAAPTNTPASTTVASGPTTTGCTLTSGTGMVVGQPILIAVTTGAPATGKVVRWLVSVAGAVVTWAPALPQAPAVADVVKACTGYALASTLPNGLDIGHYLTSVNYEGSGCVVDQLKFMLDANDEIRWSASGPMIERIRPAQTVPGAFTVVGSTPPSGLTGNMRIAAAAYEFLKLEVTISNSMELDNFAFGTSKAQAFYRKDKRKVEVSINSMYSSDLTLMTSSEGTTSTVVSAQCGTTEGSIVAIYCPAVEFEVPDYTDDETTMNLTYKGISLGVVGNDEVFLAVA